MILIAGLGNPENKYDNTRHNVGFEVIDRISEMYHIPVITKKHRALIGQGIISGMKMILAKPQTYMNLSGESIRQIAEYYNIPAENILVVSDDVNLDLGALRIRPSGSAGGHNGLKNIILQLATDGFKRLRVGVGKQPEEMGLIDFVLSHFSAAEKKEMEEAYERAAKAAICIFTEGEEKAQNLYNGKKE